MLLASSLHLVAQGPRPAPDLVVFTNGEQLTGTLEKVDGKQINFKSLIVGIDDFIHNTPAGTKRNSSQFNFNLTYTITPR